MQLSRAPITACVALLLGALPLIAAHGDGHMQTEQEHQSNATAGVQEAIPNYFRHPYYAGWMYAHIALMVISWIIVLPPALVLSVARSRYQLPAQIIFHGINSLGLFTGFVYHHSTPDLYTSNSHHPIGWIVTSLTVLWTLLSVAVAYSHAKKRREPHFAAPRISGYNQTDDSLVQEYVDSPSTYRYSRDSGNFSGRSHSNSSDSIFEKDETIPLRDDQDHRDFDSRDTTQSDKLLRRNRLSNVLARIGRLGSKLQISAALRITQIVLEKFLLLLGFLAITSGFIVYGGLFKDREIYSGLAHFIKGGIFFWYGMLTLGRWMGAFAEFGWAWNVRPQHVQTSKWKALVPSAEFTESFVIWLYGASNVFMEHLNNWGGTWSPQDFEHISITILFFGGGLFGMMIESRALRNLTSAPEQPKISTFEDVETNNHGFKFISDDTAHLDQPRLSLNPMPALTIMFLGMMMSGHHQSSMVSTMLHAQWGMMFTGFAMARAVTYVMLYIKPPTSKYPSHPPSELVAAFCLTAGGILFMNSARDVVVTIEENGLDAMTIFTLTIGLTGVIMAWELVCYTIKVWAVRRERQRHGRQC